MGKEKKEIELQQNRAMVSLPKSAIMIDVTCKLLDENKKPFSASMTMDTDDVWDAFRRADDGYWYDEDEPHVELVDPEDSVALIYLPEDAIFAHFKCRCIASNGESVKIERSLSMVDIRRAFKYASDNYIDEDDRFTLTDAGREALKEILGSKE